MKHCFQVFHLDNDQCGFRHRIRDELVKALGDHFTCLGMQTVGPSTLVEAEEIANRLNLKFNHSQEDRKSGTTGFLKGAIGVWLSTIMTLREFLATDFEILLILEDDVYIESKGVSIVSQYIPKLPKSFDFLFLYTPENQYSIYGRKRHVKAYLQENFLFDDSTKLTRAYQHWSTAAYLVSRKGAKKLLKSVENEISLPVDWHILRGNFKSFSFKPDGPKPIGSIELLSTIQNDRLPEQ